MIIDNGWIKLHRCTLDNYGIMSLNDMQFSLLIKLLMSAEWEERSWVCKRCHQKIIVLPGTICGTCREIGKRFSVATTNVYRTLIILERLNIVFRQEAEQCHVLYVFENWDKYQLFETKAEHKRNISGTKAEHRRNKDIYIRTKEDKNIRTKEESHADACSVDLASYLVLADKLRDTILISYPEHRIRTTYTETIRNDWSRSIRLLVERDGVGEPRILSVLEWLPGDDFWPKNVQSGKTLRRQFDKLEAAMKKPNGKKGQIKMNWSEVHEQHMQEDADYKQSEQYKKDQEFNYDEIPF